MILTKRVRLGQPRLSEPQSPCPLSITFLVYPDLQGKDFTAALRERRAYCAAPL